MRYNFCWCSINCEKCSVVLGRGGGRAAGPCPWDCGGAGNVVCCKKRRAGFSGPFERRWSGRRGMAYQYLLFDADNTLFDFDQAERNAHLLLCRAHGLVFSEEGYQLYHRCNAELFRDAFLRQLAFLAPFSDVVSQRHMQHLPAVLLYLYGIRNFGCSQPTACQPAVAAADLRGFFRKARGFFSGCSAGQTGCANFVFLGKCLQNRP